MTVGDRVRPADARERDAYPDRVGVIVGVRSYRGGIACLYGTPSYIVDWNDGTPVGPYSWHGTRLVLAPAA